MTVETRCEWSDLPASMCACTHCRPDVTLAVPDIEIEARLRARYNGRCGLCNGPIVEGEVIGRTTDRDYVCERCLP